jgi:hypothetical protein
MILSFYSFHGGLTNLHTRYSYVKNKIAERELYLSEKMVERVNSARASSRKRTAR